MMNLFKKKLLGLGLLYGCLGMASVSTAFARQTNVENTDTLALTLHDALEIALSESPTILIADQEISKKEYAKKGAYAKLYPQIDFGANYTRTLKKQMMYMNLGDDMTSIPGMGDIDMDEGFEVGLDNNWTMGFNASMPLVNASLWKSLTVSAIDVELAVEQARGSRVSMIHQVKKCYYGVLLSYDSYDVFRDRYENAYRNYVDIKKKYEQGAVAEFDLIRADVTLKNSEPDLHQSLNGYLLSLWQLKAVIGMDLEQPIVCSGSLADYQGEMFADFLSTDTTLVNNSDLRQIDIQTKQLKETLKMQKYEYLPSLSLSSLYQWMAMNNDFKFKDYQWNPYSTVGISLSIPLFQGGSRHHKMKQTNISISQMELQRVETERQLKLTVKQHLDNMSTCVKKYSAAEKGIEQAERSYLIAQKRYDTGSGTLLELNDAELGMTQAKLNYNQSIHDYISAKADLEKIVGENNISIKK